MLEDELRRYYDSGICPMHMPGHKRKTIDDLVARFSGDNQKATTAASGPSGDNLKTTIVVPENIDITEITGFDNLHCPTGLIKEVEAHIASLYGCSEAKLLVGGSTAGILSAVCAAAAPGEKIIISRNCHASVYHAALVQGLRVSYVMPDKDGTVSAEAFEKVLEDNPDAVAAVITCPTYEGMMSNVAAIAEAAHKKGAVLIVDAAHGAHLTVYSGDFFPVHPILLGADIAVTSFHKTLPALTMTAAVLLKDGRFSDRISHQLDIFETSSPSYVLMASVSKMLSFLEQFGREAFDALAEELSLFYKETADLESPAILSSSPKDPSKIVVISDCDIHDRLLLEYGIELEMSCEDYSIAMTSIADDRECFGKLKDALIDINLKDRINNEHCKAVRFNSEEAKAKERLFFFDSDDLPEQKLTIRDAYYSQALTLPIDDAEGRVSSGFVSIFPPEIPIAVPGEVLGEYEIQTIKAAIQRKKTVHGLKDGRISCVIE